jgi:hypothetical protein
MTIAEMLERMGSEEITDWAAVFSIEDEDAKKAQDGKQNDNEDITNDLIAAIDQDREELEGR